MSLRWVQVEAPRNSARTPARVDAATSTVLEATATPRVLPWFECPEAAASAGRLAGRTLDSLRAGVRAEFLGASTCTHLNDMLRALADVGELGSQLVEPTPPLQ